jgi:hypothetical protein
LICYFRFNLNINCMKTVKLFGRDIPTTKEGMPNLRSLTKEEKKAFKEFVEKKSNQKKELMIQDLEKFFSGK